MLIPEIIRFLKEHQFDEAGWVLFENNSLTTICSLICNDEENVKGIVYSQKGAAVHFSLIENYISNTYAPRIID